MPANRSTILGCLLALSVGVHVWTLTHRAEPVTPRNVRPLDGPVAAHHAGTTLAPRGAADLLGNCHQQRVTASQALASATEDKAQLIEPKKRFERGVRQPGME